LLTKIEGSYANVEWECLPIKFFQYLSKSLKNKFEMLIIHEYTRELIASGILLSTVFIAIRELQKIVLCYAKSNHTVENAQNLVVKYISVFLYILASITLSHYLGVQTKDLT
jgi:hypothetical protein